jgi:signal transduction histidine kinase
LLKRSSFGLPDKHATALVLGYAIAYGLLFLLGRYTIGLIEFSLWFPAAGLRFAALLIFGWRFALIAAFGELAVQGILGEWSKWGSGFEVQMVCGVAGPPIIYGLVVWVLQRFGLTLRPFTFRHTIWLLIAALIAPALTAPVSTGFLHLANRLPLDAFWPATLSFWVGDAVGIFMLAPVLLAIWLGRSGDGVQRRSGAELINAPGERKALMEIGVVLGVSVGLFVLLGMPAHPTFWYPLFLPMVVLSMRHGWFGAIPTIFVFNVMAAWIAAGLNDPFQRLDLQVFLIVMSASGLLIAAIVKDRERAEAEKRQQLNEFAHENRLEGLNYMASHIVHELSAPLSAMSTFAKSGLRRIQQSQFDTDVAKITLVEIDEQTERMTGIVQGVKRLARQQAGLTELIEVAPLLERVAAILKIAAKASGSWVTIQHHAERLFVQGDAVLLEQALINIGRNGIEAMSSDPGKLTLVVTHDAKAVQIVIGDQGQGMSEAEIAELFRPRSSVKPDGMGVGLSLVKAIIEAHEGKLSVQSNPDQGSQFVVDLPRAPVK